MPPAFPTFPSPPRPRIQREVARSVGLTNDLIPVLDPLFANLTSLGGTPRRLASLVVRFAPPTGSRPLRVLDLACGKGATTVAIARRLSCRALGVDACEGFLQVAHVLADRYRVASRCRFVHADVRAFARTQRQCYDVALMIGLYPINEAAPLLRSLVRPGGIYVLDDAVRQPHHPRTAEFDSVPDARECAAAIHRFGDRIIHRVTLPRAAVASQSAAIHARLASAAATLAKSHPGLAPSLRAFVSRHRAAAAVLLGPLRPTIFVVRRVQCAE